MANLLSTTVTGTVNTTGRVVVGGNFSNNPYNSVASTRLHFGGGDSDANDNYYIGTNLNNYGGNYTKLDLRWHTGIRMGARPEYGGIRFFNNETLASRIMSIGETDGNVRIDNILIFSSSNSTMISNGSMTDAIGYNTSYGTYIGSTVGGTYYIYGNGRFYDNGTVRTLIHSGNIGSQSVNYATSSGNSATTSQIVFSDLKINFPSGAGGGHSFGANHYSMGLDSGNGGWDHPHYRDVIIGYHTGIRIGANYSGIRFYDNSPTTDANNDGNGDGGEKLLMTIGGYVGTANHTDVVVNNNLFANVSMRAPIFYDSQDTGYYVDPNSTSSLNRIVTTGRIEVTYNTDRYQLNLSRISGSNWWFTNDTDKLGLHLNGTGDKFYFGTGGDFWSQTNGWLSTALDNRAPKAYITDSYVDFTIEGDANTYYPVTIHNWNGAFSWQRYSIHRNYGDTAPWDPLGTGSHKGGLTFAFEWAGDIAWGGNDKSIRVIEFNETYTTMVAGMQLAHCEGVVVWLRGGGAYYRLHGPGGRSQSYTINMSTWTSCEGTQYSPRSYDSGRVNSQIYNRYPLRGIGDTIYAQSFVDINDEAYYLNPNGASNLSQLTTSTRARWNMPRTWYDRSSRASDQSYWTGTNGWGTEDGNWDGAWRGGFSGWDIWGTGTSHPQGSGYVHAQGIVSGQHAANSDGSSGYGWMIVGAANATDNRYWLRGKWGSTTSGWVEMITTGNIGSQSVSYASNADTVDGYHETSFIRLAANSSSPTNGAFAIGTASDRNFIQSHSGRPLDINPLGNDVNVGSTLSVSGNLNVTGKQHYLGTSSNWDLVGFSNLTNLHFQGHNQFWIGAGNAYWYRGAISAEHDLLISTMQGYSSSAYYRGITFAVDVNANGSTGGYRLGRWQTHDTDFKTSRLQVDASLCVGYGARGTRAYDEARYPLDRGVWGHGRNEAGYGDERIRDYLFSPGTNGGGPWGSFASLEVSSPFDGNSDIPALFRMHQWGSGSVEFWKPQGTTLFIRESPGGGGSWFRTLQIQGIVTSTDSFRAPIFYDSQDTTYYGDFSSRSVLNSLQLGNASSDTSNLKLDVQGNMAIRGSNGLYFGVTTSNFNSWSTRIYASGSTQYFNGQSFRFNNDGYGSNTFAIIDADGIYLNGWYRTYGTRGLYFQDYAYGIWPATTGGNSYGNIATYGDGANSWPGYAITNIACFMARDIRRGIFLQDKDSWLIRYENSINEAVVDFQLSWGSDIRYKSNVNTISSALEKVTSLRGVTYNYKGAEKTSIGFIAQEVEQVVPEVVSTDLEGYKSVAYANMVALLTEAIKEQQTIINDLKARIELLESK
jgi:hypothetical protein